MPVTGPFPPPDLRVLIQILQRMVENKHPRHRPSRMEDEFFGVNGYGAYGYDYDYTTPEIQIIIRLGLAQFWPNTRLDNGPGTALRLLDHHEKRVETIIQRYLDGLLVDVHALLEESTRLLPESSIHS